MCPRKRDDSFYDKSPYRPICTKEHYAIYLDKIKTQKKKFTTGKHIKQPEYEYPTRGRLTLANYNLNIW
jgi:hypothetical protein